MLESRACVRVWLFSLIWAWLLGSSVAAQKPVWQVPGDPEELQRACTGRPGLETFGQNGYLGIECGYQAALLGSRLPVAPAAHVPWAKPYARGPIKLLIVTSFGNSYADVDELAQVTRELDLDVRWLMVGEMAVAHPELSDERYRNVFVPEQARAALREDYDAILITFGTNTPRFGSVRAHPYLPDDVFRTILDKVHAGTGLVIVGQNSAGYWVNDSPLKAALPARMTSEHFRLSGEDARITDGPDGALFRGIDFEPRWYTEHRPLIVYGWRLRRDAHVLARAGGHPLAMARMHGQGRILLLGWDGTLGPRRHASRMRIEHNNALTLKALSFAARKEPEVLLDLSQPRISAGEPGLVSATLTAAAQLELTLRDDAFRTLNVLTVQARAGENALRLPALAQGEYFLQAIARDPSGRVLTWGDQKLSVDGVERLTVSTDREIYKVGDTVRVSAQLQNSAELMASLTVRDATGRVLARQQRVFSGDVQFDYPISGALTAPHRATVEVSRGTAPLVQSATPFFVPNTRWDDYENVLWPMSRAVPTSRPLRDEAGVTAIFDSLGQDEVSSEVAHFGQHIGRMNDAAVDVGLVQTQPLTAAQAPKEMVRRAIEVAKRYGSLLWVLQDERHQSADPGPPDAEGVRRYREYLRAQYGSLAALNKSWAARYGAWDEVQPTLTAAVQGGVSNLAPWLDFRLYVADQAYQLDAQLAQEIRAALGQDSRVGIDGVTTSRQALPYAAIDFGRLAADGVFDLYVPYNDDFVLASLIKGPKAKYVGASMSRAEYFGAPWRDVFRGHWGTLRFFGPTFASELGHLQPAGRWTGESTRELRHGVGKLLIGSERELSPVVILYSYPALVANSGAHFWETRHGGAALAWAAGESREVLEQLLWAAGVSFGYQTDAQVERGGLKGKRLLIVPRQMGVALSTATARAIEQFVRDGGTVLADLAPGICDEHGKPRAVGALDGLFGVQTAAESIVRGEREFRAGVLEAHALVPKGKWFLDEWYDRGLRVRDGRALGAHVVDRTPAFIVKQTGRGQALLLNTLLAPQLPGPAIGWPEQHMLMRALLAATNIPAHAIIESTPSPSARDADATPPARSAKPDPATATDPARSPATPAAPTGEARPTRAQETHRETHCEANQFRDGNNAYIGFYAHRDPEGDPQHVRARFPDEKETYDMRTGRHLGRVREVSLPLRAQEAALFARLDYTLHKLELGLPPTAALGQTATFTLKLDASKTPGRHVAHVEVLGPSGTVMPLYTQNVVLETGRGQLQLDTALNDPPGTWQIRAREVVSGLTAHETIELR